MSYEKLEIKLNRLKRARNRYLNYVTGMSIDWDEPYDEAKELKLRNHLFEVLLVDLCPTKAEDLVVSELLEIAPWRENKRAK